MIQFESLSFDIQLTILNFLEPLDILALRKTCKALQRTTSERIIWINALLRVCVQNTIFMPTFPIHDMSLSALEYAATGPARFLHAAAKSNRLEPRSQRMIRYKHDLRKIYLVPGGRYLVTVDVARVAVWDLGILGYSSTVTQSMKPISSLSIHPEFTFQYMVVHATEDGRGLTIFIGCEFEEILRFTVLQIYPSDNFPSLLKIAEVDVVTHTLPSYCSLSRNKISYLLGSTLNIWDYAEDAWASIQVASDYKQIEILESTILLLYCDVILIWKMPPLSTRKPLFSGSPPSNIPPAFILKIPNVETVKICRGYSDWYTGSKPLLFEYSDGNEFQRFGVVHTNEDFSDSVVTTLGKYLDSDDCVYDCSRFCNDTLVDWWIANGRSEAHVTSLPSSATEPIDSTILLRESWNNSRSLYLFPSSLCPFSGRFAYADELDCLTIVDYFSESLPMEVYHDRRTDLRRIFEAFMKWINNCLMLFRTFI